MIIFVDNKFHLYEWYFGKKFPEVNEERKVCSVIASGQELTLIRNCFQNLPNISLQYPFEKEISEMIWREGFAQFIYDHIGKIPVEIMNLFSEENIQNHI